MKQLIFILLLALGIQTQAQIPPPTITNVSFSQEGCLLNVSFVCATCSDADALHIYYFNPFVGTAGLWIDIAVMQSSYGAYKNTISIPLCTMDTALHSPGLVCTKDGVSYRVTTETNYNNLSGARAFINGRFNYSGQFVIPVLSTPNCGGSLPPAPEMATPAKKKGGKK